MNSIGSIWRKWDLHIHTPASFQWKGRKLDEQGPSERDATCKAILDKMNSLDIDAFCVMDYWIFDGYLAIKEYLSAHATATSKTIFPGIELRLEAPTNHRLNTHVIFDDAIPAERLAQFLSRLSMGSVNGNPPSRQNFIDLARNYDDGKLRTHGCKAEDRSDEGKMHLLGMQTAVVNRVSLESALEMIGEGRYLIVQPYDTNDGLEDLDWQRHPYTDSYLMKLSDIFETRHPIAVDLFLGHGHPNKPHVGPEFIHNLGGSPKPVVSGSDAHSIADYGNYPSNRATWLKAQPTFAGIRHVCQEPALRCFIGSEPPEKTHYERNPTKYMRRLQIDKIPESQLSDAWFHGTDIPLNPGLVAIIGNKGTGKSALADILALLGNSHRSQFEFLTARRFRKGDDLSKEFKATLTWADGKPQQRSLDQDPDLDQPERVRYLPQQFIESLCTEIEAGGGNFEQELKNVIFSRVPEDKQLQKSNLDELIEYRVAPYRKATTQLRDRLHTLNSDIARTEREVSEDTIKSYRAALSLKQAELEAHEKSIPTEVPRPSEDAQTADEVKTAHELAKAQLDLQTLSSALTPLKSERTALVANLALINRLSGHLDNLQNSYDTFIEQTASEFAQAGFSVREIASLTIDRIPISAAITSSTERLSQIAQSINGSAERFGLEGLAAEVMKKIAQLQNDLGTRQRDYQSYLARLGEWQSRKAEIEGNAEKPDTIQFLKVRIRASEDTLPTALNALREQRKQTVREIHAEMLRVLAVYRELYSSIQAVAGNTALFTKEQLQLEFKAFLSTPRFREDFLDFIHRHKVGNFYGEVESEKLVDNLLSRRNFNSTEDVLAFLDDVMNSLTTIDRDGDKESIAIQSQLRSSKRIDDLYDFLFGLRYLEPRYTLQLGGKDVAQLSAGEKGALLLVFYLLLDPEEIPIVIDQPEQNLDNESVVRLLVDCIRFARSRRQVFIVTHNPNLAVVCDADQIISCQIDKAHGNNVTYDCGALEDSPINRASVNVLEGTYPAFDNRRRKYFHPATAAH